MAENIGLPWFPLHVARFMGSRRARSFNAEQVGIYFLLLMDEWAGGPLPDDDQELSIICRNARSTDVRLVLDRCFDRVENGWTNDVLEEIRNEQLGRRRSASLAGKASAKARGHEAKKHKGNPTVVKRTLNDSATVVEQSVGSVEKDANSGSVLRRGKTEPTTPLEPKRHRDNSTVVQLIEEKRVEEKRVEVKESPLAGAKETHTPGGSLPEGFSEQPPAPPDPDDGLDDLARWLGDRATVLLDCHPFLRGKARSGLYQQFGPPGLASNAWRDDQGDAVAEAERPRLLALALTRYSSEGKERLVAAEFAGVLRRVIIDERSPSGKSNGKPLTRVQQVEYLRLRRELEAGGLDPESAARCWPDSAEIRDLVNDLGYVQKGG